MRILNQNKDDVLHNVLLLLTVEEASEFRDELIRLLSSVQLDDHGHINDSEYIREITVAIYNEKNIGSFNDRIKKLIIEDK